jgi:anti-sigma B factor antagonist
MDVKSNQVEGVVVYHVNGEINISTSPQLKKLFEGQASKKVVINLAGVTYIDSSGLATLVEMLKKMKTQGGALGLAAMSEKVKSLFEITKLDRLFSVFPTHEEAVSRVK